jgi:hypothetical protein
MGSSAFEPYSKEELRQIEARIRGNRSPDW